MIYDKNVFFFLFQIGMNVAKNFECCFSPEKMSSCRG